MKLSLALLCALFGLLAAGCGRQAAPAAAGKTEAAPRPEAAPLAVRTAAAEQRSVERSIVATGSLLPDDTVTISSEVQGRVAKIHYDFGQSVRQGAVLVELDPTEYDLQIERARGALNQALARLGLPAYAGKMSPPESTPALRQVLAQLEDTRFKYESAAKLVKTGDVSQERFTEAEKAYRARQAAVELARDEMRVAWMSVTALEADLKIVQKRRNDTVVRAPFDAEVGEKVAAVGAVCQRQHAAHSARQNQSAALARRDSGGGFERRAVGNAADLYDRCAAGGRVYGRRAAAEPGARRAVPHALRRSPARAGRRAAAAGDVRAGEAGDAGGGRHGGRAAAGALQRRGADEAVRD